MLGFLKGDPKKKLQKQYEAKLAKALDAQRNGDLRTHGTLITKPFHWRGEDLYLNADARWGEIYAEIQALDEKK